MFVFAPTGAAPTGAAPPFAGSRGAAKAAYQAMPAL